MWDTWKEKLPENMDNDSHNGEDAKEKEVEEQEYRARQKNISAPK